MCVLCQAILRHLTAFKTGLDVAFLPRDDVRYNRRDPDGIIGAITTMTDTTKIPSKPNQAIQTQVPTITRKDGMSWEEFSRTWDEIGPFELINGAVIPMPPKVHGHNKFAHNIDFAINTFAKPRQLGEAYTEGTFIRPDSEERNWIKGSRIPDVLYYRMERLKAYYESNEDWETKPLALAPDLVVEIISSNDTHHAVSEKVEGYLAMGVQIVWVITPPQRIIEVHTAGSNTIEKLTSGDALSGGTVLPEFTMAVDDVFGT